MPRKSRELRTNQTLSLIQEYEKDNLQSDYRYRFLSDVYARLTNGRHLTARQRSWLDSLIEEGAPKINRDNALISQIQEVVNLPGLEHRKGVLRDFLARLSSGRDLSEKQAAFLTGILEEADKVKRDGPYSPTEEIKKKLSQCVLLSKSYSSMWWQTHPGTARALSSVKSWIEGESEHVDEWSVNKALKAMSAKLREIEKPYVSSGDLVWCKMAFGDPVTGVVSGEPEINQQGHIVYPVLTSGSLSLMDKSRIAKRAKKKKEQY